MPDYPADLPHLARLSHQEETLGMDVLRTSMSAGPQKVRTRTSFTPDNLSLGHNAFTKAQKGIFDTFFKTTLVRGALSFDMDDPDGGSGTFRFTSAPKWKPVGDEKYSLAVEVERL